MAKRPNQIPIRPVLDHAGRRLLARRATYVGSKEHKIIRWWGGLPGVRMDRRTGQVIGRPHKQKTTICHVVDAPSGKRRATAWVKAAIRSGRYRFLEGDGEFPKHVWYRVAGQAWFGYCLNTAVGEYKGWPLENDDTDAKFD
jgi:hypothetical protein